MDKKLRVTVDGQSYDVSVEKLGVEEAPAGSAPTPPRVERAPATPSGSNSVVPSPLAGKVVAIDKPAGSQVAEGETLITLEAMKMNTFVVALVGGTVTDMLVGVGDSVEEGQTLARIN